MHRIDKEIVRLAVPAFGALIAEPLFLLIDSIFVGRLGVNQLAAIGVASVLLNTIVGLFVFLAYASTPIVARFIGEGKPTEAIKSGVQGIWLALFLGLTLLTLSAQCVEPMTSLLSSSPLIQSYAAKYLTISTFGLPPMLVMTASIGLIRGLQDTVTPLVITIIGTIINAITNYILIFPCHLGMVGSAIGTVVTQYAMATTFLVIVLRLARKAQAEVTPTFKDIAGNAKTGGWLFLRSAMYRLALLILTWYTAHISASSQAAIQVMLSIYAIFGYALDSIAIAAQAIIARYLGASGPRVVRVLIPRFVRWSVIFGAVFGVVLMCVSPAVKHLFTHDATVLELLTWLMVMTGIFCFLGGYVFVLDGILMGSRDVRYLGLISIANTACEALWITIGSWLVMDQSLLVRTLTVWSGWIIAFLGMRAFTLYLRIHSNKWIH